MKKLRRYRMMTYSVKKPNGNCGIEGCVDFDIIIGRVLKCVKAGAFKLFEMMMSSGEVKGAVKMPAVRWPELEEAQNMIGRYGAAFPEFRGTDQERFLMTMSYRNRKGGTAYFF